jgi:hypothetical protein
VYLWKKWRFPSTVHYQCDRFCLACTAEERYNKYLAVYLHICIWSLGHGRWVGAGIHTLLSFATVKCACMRMCMAQAHVSFLFTVILGRFA